MNMNLMYSLTNLCFCDVSHQPLFFSLATIEHLIKTVSTYDFQQFHFCQKKYPLYLNTYTELTI